VGRLGGRTSAKRVWQDEPLSGDENASVTILDGQAYIIGRQRIRVLAIASGKPLAEQTFENDGPGSNAWLSPMGERLLLSPEGQHGSLMLQSGQTPKLRVPDDRVVAGAVCALTS
jgi:hypothetical protein